VEEQTKEIQSVLIVGAGAVGAAAAGMIASNAPGAVSLLAAGNRLQRYRSGGFLLNGVRHDFSLVTPDQRSEPDLIIIAVKNYHLPQTLHEMRSHVGSRTLIISLLNGISSEAEIAAAFGKEKVLYAMILGIDAVRSGNEISFSSTGKIHFGDAANLAGAWSERVARVAAFFDRTGVAHVVPPNMIRSLWYKFMINVGINQVSAILRGAYRVFQTEPSAKAVMDDAMAEVVALSKAMKTGLEESDIASWHATLMGFAPENKTSMLQDVEARRQTEVEAFAGTVIRLGRAAGVPVPVNAVLYNLLKAIEASYGKNGTS
jgi:2-dehydropantoate 2-reductase